MKKLTHSKMILVALFLSFTFLQTTSFGQSSQTLNPKIDPQKSRGYTYWDSYPNARLYEVNLLGTDAQGNYFTISSSTTENNYFKFDQNSLHLEGRAYQITAIDIHGDDIAISPAYPGYLYSYPEEICRIDCNGTNYAWRLTASQEYNSQGDPTVVTLTASGANQFFDPVTYDVTPYWQAMSYTAHDALPLNHPYTLVNSYSPAQSGDDNYVYKHIRIEETGNSYIDAQNNVLTQGWLVEKRMNQYQFFSTAYTPSTSNAGVNICSNSLTGGGGWVDYFNAYAIGYTFPSVPGYFSSTVPTELGCISAYTPYNPNANNYNDGWNDWVIDLYDEVKQIEDYIADNPIFPINGGSPLNYEDIGYVVQGFVSEPTSGINNAWEEEYLTGFTIKHVSQDNADVHFSRTNVNDIFNVSGSNNNLVLGLHEINFYSSLGNVFPSYIKIDVPQIEEDNEEAGKRSIESNSASEFQIYPNPSKDLVHIKLDKIENGEIKVFGLDGKVLVSKVFTETSNIEINLSQFSNGQYIFQINTASDSYTKKVIKH